MKKKIWIIIIAMVAVLAIAAGSTVAIFRSPGVHIWGDYVSINLNMPCYIYDTNTDTFLERSEVEYNAWAKGLEELNAVENEKAMLEVEAYPVPTGEDIAISTGKWTWSENKELMYEGFTMKYGGVTFVDGEPVFGEVTYPRAYYGFYNLEKKQLALQIASDSGEWLVALTGFESEEAVREFLRTENGKNLAETPHFGWMK